MTRKLFAVLILFVLFPWGGVDASRIEPVPEEPGMVFISTQREVNMGRKIDRKVRERFDDPVDPLMRKRVKEIGVKLAEHTDRRDVVYYFELLNVADEDVYNAFAAPGGYIYIFQDMANALETDDRIAAVLAHEMGHVEARHSIKRLQGSIGATALMLLGSQMASDRGTQARANTAIGQLMAAYSREDEKEADELSVRYLEKAGYDPQASVEVLEWLRDKRMEGPRRRHTFSRSHPYLSQRIAHLKSHIQGHMDFDSYINLPFEREIDVYR